MGGDDVFHSTAAKFINAGEDFNTTITADVPTAGSYYFKLVAYFGTDSSVSSRSFDAIAASSGESGGGGGGGGGGSNSPSPSVTAAVVNTSVTPADLNSDGKTNSIDFSILLYFWKSTSVVTNPYVDMNKDGKIDSIDFSILLYRWDK